MIIAMAVFAAVAVTGLTIVLGGRAIRWLGLDNAPPPDLAYEPRTPEIRPPGDPAAARERAAAGAVVARRGARVRAAIGSAQQGQDLAGWIADCDPARAEPARQAAAAAMAAATRADAAFTAADDAAVESAALEVATAIERLRRLGDGLPDWRAAERRKLLILSALLVAALLMAVLALR